MAAGGVRDQLGGGFHRYSTDAHWLVPHFEQMLYDNAQLARVYVHAWALTGEARYLETATGTLDYLLRELRMPEGGFAASQDADTEGRGGGDLRLVGRRDPRGPGRRRRAVRRGVRRHGRRELGGSHDPVADARRHRARGAVRAPASGGGRAAGRGAAAVAGTACLAAPARPGRQGAGGLERPRDRCARGRGPGARRGGERRARCRRRIAIATRPSRRPARSRPGSWATTDACVARGRTVAGPRTACSRTTRTWPRASSPCTRRPATSGGSRPSVASRT